MWVEKLIKFLHQKSLGNREDIIELMRKMYLEVDREKLTMGMLLASFGLGVVVFLAVWPNIFFGFVLGSAVTIAGWSLPKRFMEIQFEKRCDTIVNQMVDALTIMSNGVKSNLTVQQCIDRVIDNLSGPIVQEFRMIKEEMKVGRPLSEALTNFGERVARQDVAMFVTSVNILEETGGKLSETFDTITETIRERQKLEKKIAAMMASGKTQAAIVTMIPFVLIGLFAAMDPEYIKPLFTKPLGWFALVIMLGLQITGGVVMKKIVTIKV